MIACVDGTGTSDDAEYARVFHRSFVNRIYNRCTHPDRIYHRGPGSDLSDGVVGTWGGRHHVAPEFVAREIVEIYNRLTAQMAAEANQERARQLGEHRKIFLAGYSRGGAIVIETAAILCMRNIPVEAMFLFDAVNRSASLQATQSIPCNVATCYHAMRNISASGSRESFGHAGRRAGTGVAFHKSHFLTTHGGMGGTPWRLTGLDASERDHLSYLRYYRPTTYEERRTGMRRSHFINEGGSDGMTTVSLEQEIVGMHQVKHWMWPHLLAHRIVSH